MRILVTGATGFVGMHLIRYLREQQPKSEIVGTIHGESSQQGVDAEPNVRLVACDIVEGDGAAIAGLIRDFVPDRIYHLAAASSGAASQRETVFRANVDGTRFVVEAVNQYAPECRILFASTGYVYGNCSVDRPAREDDRLPDPTTLPLYAESKIEAERTIRAARSFIVARAFNHTGPGQAPNFVVPAFASQIVQVESGEMHMLKVGNLEAVRDFLDVRDVVRAYRALAEHGLAGETYNVCSGIARRMSDILDPLIAMAHEPVQVVADSARLRPADIAVSVGDSSKLRFATGWHPEIAFSQTLADTLEFYRAAS